MKIRPALASASALGAVMSLAIFGGCENKISRCSSDSDCPLGTCDLTVNRCAFAVCAGGAACPPGTACNQAEANLCLPIPDGGTNDCTPACPSYQLCVFNQCLNRYSGIAIVQPQNGAFLDGGTPILAQLGVNVGFARQDPSSLALATRLPDGGTIAGSLALTTPGTYQGALVPMGDGQYQLTARYDAASLSSIPVTVTILTVRPSFILTMPPIPVGPDASYLNPIDPALMVPAWRRDQVMLLDIKSANPNLATVTVTVTGVGPRSVPAPVTVDAGCVQQPYCATALVDFSAPDMNAFRGPFVLLVTGTDRAGNVGVTDAGVQVTRWKWAFQSLDGLPIRTSPAIGSSGTVYVGTSNDTNTGTVYAINPDGTLKWSNDGGWTTASLAVGELDGGIEPVYAAMNGATTTSLRALNGLDGGDLVLPCGPFPGAIRASLAVTKIDGGAGQSPAEACFAAINSPDGGVMLAMRPFPGPPIPLCIDGGTVNPGGVLLEPAAVAVDNANNTFFALSSLRVQSLLFNDGWQTRANWPVDAGANSVALALAGNQVVGSATTADGGDGGVFAINGVGQIAWSFPDGGHGGLAWNPSVASGGTVFYGDEAPGLTSVMIPSSTPVAQTTDAGVSRGAPALGNDNTLYVADSRSNTLSARNSMSLNPIWTVNSFGVNPFEASLALDCSRDGGAPIQFRPGVLYAPDNTRNLYSFITDSRGIDPFSAWPKYQHDPRNTGNQQTPLLLFACP